MRRSAAGIPADMGVVTMNQSWVEKNECCRHTATTSRPVSGPRQAYRGCRCVGPVETELDHLGAWDQVDKPLGGFTLDPVRPGEIDPAASERRTASITGSNP